MLLNLLIKVGDTNGRGIDSVFMDKDEANEECRTKVSEEKYSS